MDAAQAGSNFSVLTVVVVGTKTNSTAAIQSTTISATVGIVDLIQQSKLWCC
jgi:hypothetical protein